MLVRPAKPADATTMARILNDVIAIGGTTAHEVPMSPGQILLDYINGPDVLSSVVVEDAGQVIGWQSVGRWHGEAHIGTFVAPGLQAKGAGTGMFALTCQTLRALGIREIIASIRADNGPGLAYYARIGFADFALDPDFALSDGRRVGRVHRRFDLFHPAN